MNLKYLGNQMKKALKIMALALILSLLFSNSIMLHVNAKSNGRVVVSPNSQHQTIQYWGHDIKQPGKAAELTDTAAEEIFNTIGMNVLRVSILGSAHPAAGQVTATGYADTVAAINRAKAKKSSIKLYANIKIGNETNPTFPSWTLNADGTLNDDKYSTLLYDYLNYMYTKEGISFNILGIACEEHSKKFGINASKHKSIVDSLKSKLSGTNIPVPLFIGPDGYNPLSDWLNDLYAGNWQNSLDIASTHYYSQNWEKLYTGKTYSTVLGDFVTAARGKPLWDTEVHWNKLDDCDDIGTAEMGLIAIFDQLDRGFVGMSWWNFQKESLGTITAQIQTNIVKTTLGGTPIDATDQDGTGLAKGAFVTRAFKNGTDMYIWVINNTTTSYTSKWFDAGKKLGTNPTYTCWTIANGQQTGTTVKRGTAFFFCPINANSITLIKVPDVY